MTHLLTPKKLLTRKMFRCTFNFFLILHTCKNNDVLFTKIAIKPDVYTYKHIITSKCNSKSIELHFY